MKGTLSQQYSGVTQSETSLQLLGIETEAYVDSGHKTTYVFAYVSRAELKRIYTERALTLREKIRHLLAAAKAAENAAKIDIAVEKYLSTYPLYEALEEAGDHSAGGATLRKSQRGCLRGIGESHKKTFRRT